MLKGLKEETGGYIEKKILSSLCVDFVRYAQESSGFLFFLRHNHLFVDYALKVRVLCLFLGFGMQIKDYPPENEIKGFFIGLTFVS